MGAFEWTLLGLLLVSAVGAFGRPLLTAGWSGFRKIHPGSLHRVIPGQPLCTPSLQNLRARGPFSAAAAGWA